MANTIELRVISDQLPLLLANLPGCVDSVLDTTANNIVTGCQQKSRVDTGQMRDGWTQETTGPQERTVYNPAPWTIYNEYGTRFMSAQPMLAPSVEENKQAFYDALGQAFYDALGQAFEDAAK